MEEEENGTCRCPRCDVLRTLGELREHTTSALPLLTILVSIFNEITQAEDIPVELRLALDGKSRPDLLADLLAGDQFLAEHAMSETVH